MVRASGERASPSTSDVWLSPDSLRAVAGLVSAVAWPVIAGVALWKLLPQLRDLLARLSDFEAFGIKAKVKEKVEKVENELKRSAEEAQTSGISQVL